MMNALLRIFRSPAVTLLSMVATSVWAEPLTVVAFPETKVLAVAPSPGVPGAFAIAFGKLVGFYARPHPDFKIVFPQMRLTLGTKHYAAIAFSGETKGDGAVEVLYLPGCEFVSEIYVGNYAGIGPAVQALIEKAKAQRLILREDCGIRIHHLNSPDDTPAEKLTHKIYVAIQPQP